MKRKLILIITLILFFGAISSVSATDDLSTTNGTFKDLNNLIQSNDELYLNNTNYIQNNASYRAININKNITINGASKETGGYSILDGNHLTQIFAIAPTSSVTLINIKFINSNDIKYGSIFNFGNLTLINSTFENNIGFCGNDITNVNILKVENCKFTTKNGTWGSIYIEMGKVDIKNSNFTDIESKYSSGIHYRAISNNSSLSILNCIFENTTSSVTAGAIGLKNTVNVLIKDTVFKNTKSTKNAGTIFAENAGNLIIENCSFINGSSDFGGALVLLSTNVKIVNSTFTNNSANYNGGAIYTSWTNMTIVNSSFNSNKGTVDSNGGAIYSDYSNFKIKNSNFINNQVTEYGSGICLHQSNMTLTNSEFRENKGKNKSLIYSVFSGNITLNNNTYDGGSISLNNTFYINDIPDEASKITLLNNTIIVENLPSKFDLRDYGWVGPIENQGFMGACWAFTTLGSLESALLKATGIQYNLSENNLQDLMIKYSNMGFIYSKEEGAPIIALTYLVSWIGPVDEDEDKYDELGKISPVLDSNIHIQNAVLVKPYGKTMDIDLIKRSLIEYGAVTYTLFWDYAYFNLNTSAYYDNSTEKVNHDVIIVGWDDNYSKDNFKITPPGDGAFIMKNSMGEEWGDKGYFYLSYYSNIGGNYEFAFKITNETYNINYQHGLGGYVDLDKFPYYASEFTSIGNDLIAAFGTFFNQTTDYKVKLYINNILEYEQEGKNEFAGYNTIHLNEKIPVKKGDIIRIEVKQLNTPVTNNSREVLEENVAFISEDGKNWIDASKNQSQGIPLIKVYTEATNLMTENIEKYYKNGTQFEALAIGDKSQGLANQTITFTINGMSYKRTTNSDGIAKLNINLKPGVYEIETKYGNTTVLNNVTVLSTIAASDLVKYFQNGSQFIAKVLDNTGNPVVGKKLTFNINGVLYNRTTNEEGIAKLNINLNPGKYVLTATDLSNGLEQSYNITVLPRLEGENIKMNYRDGTKYNVKLVSETGTPLQGEEIILNINGVFYNKITNNDGVASLAINLMPGAYIITAYYKNEATSNMIWIT